MRSADGVLEDLAYGVAVAEPDKRLSYVNRRARELLMPAAAAGSADAPLTCCDAICDHLEPVLGGGCLSERARAAAAILPEVRMDLETGTLQSAAWVTASPAADGDRVVFHLRPGQPGDRRRRTEAPWAGRSADEAPDLQITTLGRFAVEGLDGPIGGDWLGQRPGQLLKFLVCERRRAVTSDQIGETLWPEAGPSESGNRLRYNVHALRGKLEPERERRGAGRFVLTPRGGYALVPARVWIDADRFEVEALAGLGAARQGLAEEAEGHLAEALALYRGDFLAGDPYLDFALPERERLRDLAGRALRARVRIAVASGRLDAAAEHGNRLAEMEPFDADAQRLVVEVCLRRGRHSEAHRRYSVYRKKLAASFGSKPGWDLHEVESDLAATIAVGQGD
ncbi:MAG TPA: BTAD domain-containing putative transcriptional regulator [Solirubrobacterales bacterium]|nr:BTAD domain-containing putative transcriptional regulator [Solirubrobacterales bacterium]